MLSEAEAKVLEYLNQQNRPYNLGAFCFSRILRSLHCSHFYRACSCAAGDVFQNLRQVYGKAVRQ